MSVLGFLFVVQFQWERMTSWDGTTGVYLQYNHARLSSLLDKTSEVALKPNVDFALLTEPEAEELVVLIAKFPSVLRLAAKEFEPCVLVHYLFDLAHAVAGACPHLILILPHLISSHLISSHLTPPLLLSSPISFLCLISVRSTNTA